MISNIFAATALGSQTTTENHTQLFKFEAQLQRRLSICIAFASSIEATCCATMATAVHCIAALVYLQRASLGYASTDSSHQALVDQGLDILSRIAPTRAAWPLFIIACEAQKDQQRMLIQQLFIQTATEQWGFALERSRQIRLLIEAYWNQDDLDAQREVSYMGKMDSVLRKAHGAPLFA